MMPRLLRQQGATMIELLVAILLMVTALSGLIALQGKSIQSNQSSYYRSIASLHALTIIELMQANCRPNINSCEGEYTLNNYTVAPYSAGSDQASKDITRWLAGLANELPEGAGKIEKDGNIYTIFIRWNDIRGSITEDDEGEQGNAIFQYQVEL